MNDINKVSSNTGIDTWANISQTVSREIDSIWKKINNCFTLSWDQIQNAEMELDSYLKWKNIKASYWIEDHEMDDFLYNMKRFHEGIPHGRVVADLAKQFWDKYTQEFLADMLAKLLKDVENPQLNNYWDIFFLLVNGNHISNNIWSKVVEDEEERVEIQTNKNFIANITESLEENILFFPRNSDELLLIRGYQGRVRVFKKDEVYRFQFVDFWTERVIRTLNFKSQSHNLEEGLDEFTALSGIEIERNLDMWTKRRKER